MGRAAPSGTVSDERVTVVGGAAAVGRVIGSAPDGAGEPGGGPEPRHRPETGEPHPGPEEAAGPVIGAGVRSAGTDGEPVSAGRAGSGAGPRAGLAGSRDPGSGREPLHGARGPVGGPVSDRLARARQVLHRVETRADVERSRPVARPGCGATAADAGPARTTGTADPDDAALLPVPGPLAGLLPAGGLRRGSTVAVGAGAGAGSLLFALLAAASAEGCWAGVVGRPGLGAAAEAGVRLDRLALVPDPGADLVGVTAALLDGLDLVVVAGPERAGLRAGDRQRLTARARQRGAVLLALGSWPGADLRLHCERPRWEGVGRGEGRLRYRRIEVRASGRGIGPAGRGAEVLLPGPGGAVLAAPEQVPAGSRPTPVAAPGQVLPGRPVVQVAG
ncbi:hypothetical protein Ae168Ps1_2428c [Pseudonocardia sp. Ae168_Ps1]|nr:hypothetical protein Ae150APs1_2423c [Pseudonocardia sp. Ae150A_Ps1]OLL80022.1 hypothetical protein Ae168Ps1_2428c [Pseudonocardia sp. Ae168_Ps1]OLL85846.1 hypothetical protein Ae263Ps1_2901 [Pseudonocardia sp. Ae263_Ps1]OLL94124.1 hypothetical protein Ae356Ps1_4021c [Pseudonocardia sp. Ae356_Ps1]